MAQLRVFWRISTEKGSLSFMFVLFIKILFFSKICDVKQHLRVSRYQIPEDWPYQEARRLFKEPLVCVDEEQLDIKWSAPDEEVSLSVKTRLGYPITLFSFFIYLNLLLFFFLFSGLAKFLGG